MVVSVKRRHDRSFADSEKFAVNGDWENPVWLSRAVNRAKVEAMEALFDGRPALSYIASSTTGEVLFELECLRDMTIVLRNSAKIIERITGRKF